MSQYSGGHRRDRYAPTQRSTPPQRQGGARRTGLSLPQALLADVLAVGLCLIVFALFHHVLVGQLQGEVQGKPLQTPTATSTPLPVATPTAEVIPSDDPAVIPTPTPEPTPTPQIYSGVWGEKFAQHFTRGEVVQDEHSYRSENIALTLQQYNENGIRYHVVDVYLSDLKYLRSGFAGGSYKLNTTDFVDVQCQQNNAVAAISGDQYGMRQEGIVVRNGLLYRDTRFGDVAVLYQDGVLETYTDRDFNFEEASARGIYQIWCFGPMLLNNGTPLTTFNTDVGGANPRSAIGYIEPGHYCLVQVDGRIDESKGMKMSELAELFRSLGCKTAYNLDGGQTAAMAWQGALVSHPYGRKATDCIYITDTPPQE